MDCTGFTIPKGYRYHPSDEELLSDLELKNQCKDSQITTIIPEIDVCKYEPRQLPELASTRAESQVRKFFCFFFLWFMEQESWRNQSNWYFFTPLDYKYIHSSRVNRTTGEGFWKITGKDRVIKAPGSNVVIGKKRILTFYKRGGPKGQKTGWVIHEYFLIQEHGDHPKQQIGEFVVCWLKYNSDNSDHDKDAPFCNRGMASNVENQAEENWSSQELANIGNDNEPETGDNRSITTYVENQAEENLASKEQVHAVPIPGGNDYEAETGGGMTAEEDGYLAYKEQENALRDPISNSSDMVEELLDNPENLDELFHPHEAPTLQSLTNTTNVRKDECCKRACPFEHDDPSRLKKNKISNVDDGKLVGNSTSNSENQAANVIPKGYSQPEAHLGSNNYLSLLEGNDYAPPSINGGPGDLPNDNDYISLDDLSPCKGINSSLAESPNTVFDGGRVTSDRNTLVIHGSESGYPALPFGALLRYS